MGSDLTTEQEIGRGASGHVRVTVRLAGCIDLGTQPLLQRALDDALAVREVREIVVDLRGLTLLDSTGIATILHAYRRGASSGVTLRTTGSTGMVHRVLDITGVLAVLSGEN